jgi:L-asparagine transporter-like permease
MTESRVVPACPEQGHPLALPAACRKLSNRHVQFIALGGTIGAGLFLGSGAGIAAAGPSLLIAYALCGLVVYLMLRALGELALADPARGSFSAYAERYLGQSAGFITGWSYWAMWALAGGAEITAIGMLTKLWYPALPQWIPACAALLLIFSVNLRGVRLFGELEFWFALVKILAIVAVIALGALLLVFPTIKPVPGAGVENLWAYGGLFPNGAAGFAGVLPVVLFAFGGVEVIGLMAADTEQRERNLPRAIRGVVVRILTFYIGSMAIIMSVAPWQTFSSGTSPFVQTLQRIGISYASDLLNLVVITAAISSCNTGLYAIGRTLAGLAERGQAPASLVRTSAKEIPARAVTASAAALGGVVFLNWLIPERILSDIMSGLSLLLLWVWLVIMLSHAAFRRRHGGAPATNFRLPLYPWSSLIVIGAIMGTAVMLVAMRTTRPAILIVVAWFVALMLIYQSIARRARVAPG